ncbi:MAG: hypothetical protein NTZ14_06760 [Hyphomicrobiales bacterium]|nr:hypothetical protein [Hyphomicrobiales bacterium]
MAYQMVKNGSVEYAVDWETIEQLNRSYHLSIATLERVQTKRVSQSSLLNPFSLAMPDIVSIEVDWDGARAAADAANVADMFHFSATAFYSMADVGRTMLERVNVAQRNKDRFRQLSRSVNQQNMANIAGAVDNYEGLIAASRFVRDKSGDVVCTRIRRMADGFEAQVTRFR